MPRSPFFALFLPSDLVNIITVLALGATKLSVGAAGSENFQTQRDGKAGHILAGKQVDRP